MNYYNKEELSKLIILEFFKHIDKGMPQSQALTLVLLNNLPKSLSQQEQQLKSPIELKIEKEKLRHKNILIEIEAMKEAGITILQRGDYEFYTPCENLGELRNEKEM